MFSSISFYGLVLKADLLKFREESANYLFGKRTTKILARFKVEDRDHYKTESHLVPLRRYDRVKYLAGRPLLMKIPKFYKPFFGWQCIEDGEIIRGHSKLTDAQLDIRFAEYRATIERCIEQADKLCKILDGLKVKHESAKNTL